MKKINLLKEIIIVEKPRLLQAINSQKYFGITPKGEITYEPDDEIVVFKGRNEAKLSALTPQRPFDVAAFLGTNYKVVENETQVAIKASLAWQEITALNYELATYDDSSGEGVSEFADEALENIGWHADEFEIGYRELIEILEERCEGTLLCVEQEEPYRFSGLGFVDDTQAAYEILYTHCQERIRRLMEEDPLYAPQNLSPSEREAARFFALLD